MSRPPRITGDNSSLRLTFTLLLNAFIIAAIIVLRFMLPATFQRPTLSLPNVDDFSLANWFANRLADLVTMLQELIRQFLQ